MEVDHGEIYTDSLSIRKSDLRFFAGIDNYAARNKDSQNLQVYKVNMAIIHAYNLALVSLASITVGAIGAAMKQGLEGIFN